MARATAWFAAGRRGSHHRRQGASRGARPATLHRGRGAGDLPVPDGSEEIAVGGAARLRSLRALGLDAVEGSAAAALV